MAEMRLSEAIRLGAMNRPQAYGSYFEKETNRTCALGAALDAIGLLALSGGDQQLYVAFPLLNLQGVPSPCGCVLVIFADTLGGRITHLNDHHHWTRERIADWVESVERAETQTCERECAVTCP
jgi:hypothetical protein